jgi:uncharacterized protein (TIGR03067 family)
MFSWKGTLSCVVVALVGISAPHIAAPLHAEPPDKKSPSDSELIRGTWKVISCEVGGKDAPEFRDLRIVFTADRLKFMPKKGADEPMTVSYKLDAAKKPKHIDTSHEIDPGKPIVQLGIYELDGDTLRYCWEAASKGRPKEFKTKANGTSQLFVLKRVKEEK